MSIITGGNLYRATSISSIGTPWEIEFDNENRCMYIFDEFALVDEAAYGYNLEGADIFRIGENLISFLELNFDEYNKQLDEFYSEYREYNFKPQKIDSINLEYFLDSLDFEHPYFYSLDINTLSKMNWDVVYHSLKIDLDKVNSLYNLICGLCNEQYVPHHCDSDIIDSAFNYISCVDDDLRILFSKTQPLQQRLHYSLDADVNNQSIKDFNLKYRYYNTSPLSFCIMEFYKMLELHIPIRRCKNCNRLFIPDSNHITDYCNRPYKKTGKTCKEVGANRTYKEKVFKNPILQEYERAYKRNYAKCKRNAIDAETFRQWIDEATIERDRVATEYEKSNDIAILDAFKKYLGNK
mgnify:CR=1 FL=1